MRTNANPTVRPRAAPPVPVADALWEAYCNGRDGGARQALVLAYQGFARILAAKAYARRVYTEMEFADYLQYATVGLLEAIDRFDPTRGIKFETYAASRITGAVLSGIEISSELQQQLTARRRILSGRLASLNENAPAPATPELAFARLAELAIGLAVGFALDGSGMHRGDDEGYADNSYHGVELKQLRMRIQQLVAGLPASQQQVVHAHYLQQLPFEEIAVTMRLSRGRIAQIHKEALGHLRARMLAMDGVDLSC